MAFTSERWEWWGKLIRPELNDGRSLLFCYARVISASLPVFFSCYLTWKLSWEIFANVWSLIQTTDISVAFSLYQGFDYDSSEHNFPVFAFINLQTLEKYRFKKICGDLLVKKCKGGEKKKSNLRIRNSSRCRKNPHGVYTNKRQSLNNVPRRFSDRFK